MKFMIPRTPEERRAYLRANASPKTDVANDLDESVEQYVEQQKQKQQEPKKPSP